MSVVPDPTAVRASAHTLSAPVLVTIVNWNTREDLRTCLETLDAGGHEAVAVVVVDNCSSDGSAAMVEAAFPWAHLIRAPRNLGFAGAVNLGIEHSTSDHVLILNPDMRVTCKDVARLAAYLEQTPSAGAVSPLLVGSDGRVQAHMYGRFPTIAQVALFWTVLSPVARRIAPLRRRVFEHDLRADRPASVDQLPGAALMMSREALRRVGPLDPGYFVWWEDVDWCYRARRCGFSLHVLPAVRCRHAGGSSFVTWKFETRVFQFYRAFYRFLAKHGWHSFAHRVQPILVADLFVKAGLIGLLRTLRLRDRQSAHTLRDARRAMTRILHDMKRGEVPNFESATPEPGDE